MSLNDDTDKSVVVEIQRCPVPVRFRTIRRPFRRCIRRTSPSMVSLSDTDSAVDMPRTAPDVDLLPPPTDVDQSHHARTRTGARAGYFCNPWRSWQGAALADVAAALRKGAVLKSPPRHGEAEEFERNGRLIRVNKPDWKGGDGVRVCWLGHASVLVRVPRPRLGGEGEQGMVGIIFDPMFSKR